MEDSNDSEMSGSAAPNLNHQRLLAKGSGFRGLRV